MKKFIAIVTVLALAFVLCVSSFATATLDAMYVNVNELQKKGAGVDSGVGVKSKVQIEPGDRLFILGWAASEGTNLEKIFWTLDGEEKECTDVYRDRPDVADAFHLDESFGTHAGFGYNEDMMELVGVDQLEKGQYVVNVMARFLDGSEETVKTDFDLIVGAEENGGEENKPNEFPKYLEVELYVELCTDGVEIEENDDGSITCVTESGTDPWISIALDEIDTSIYTSFIVKYELDGPIHPNNIYLKDMEKNIGYSGTIGTWAMPAMDGLTERVCSIEDEFGFMSDTILTGVRFPGAKEGGSLTIKSITFVNPNGINIRDFSAEEGDGLSFDQILVNGASVAEGNDAVIAKKKAVDGTDGSVQTIGFYGWYGNANSGTAAIGYKINDNDVVYGDFFSETGDDVTGLNANNRRFTVTVDVAELKGENTIWIYAMLANGDQVKLNRFDNRGAENEKDREIYVVYNGPVPATPTPTEEPTPTPDASATEEPVETAENPTEKPADSSSSSAKKGCGGVIGGSIALIAAAACIVVLKKKH